ncbi:MAG: sigma-70 family RNA polymerase sigma factor [Eubacteriales bacterium]|nr:sigma-70 family RNA polymerase sigma factor [Eubacteriales bacterium]
MTNEDFEDIYLKYQGFSKDMARKFIKDEAVVDDIVQEVFCRLYKMCDKVDISCERKLRAFITTVTVNMSKDHLKKPYVKNELCVMDREDFDLTAFRGFCSIESLLDDIEANSNVKMVLQRLWEWSPTNYEIIMKVKCDGQSPDSVAAEYGISKNNVNNRVMRTRRWIKKELEK